MKQIYSPFLLNKEASPTSDFTLTFHFSRKALITNKVQKYQFLLVYAIEKQQWILRTFKCQVQKYHNKLKNTFEGEEKSNFSLGRRFSLY